MLDSFLIWYVTRCRVWLFICIMKNLKNKFWSLFYKPVKCRLCWKRQRWKCAGTSRSPDQSKRPKRSPTAGRAEGGTPPGRNRSSTCCLEQQMKGEGQRKLLTLLSPAINTCTEVQQIEVWREVVSGVSSGEMIKIGLMEKLPTIPIKGNKNVNMIHLHPQDFTCNK